MRRATALALLACALALGFLLGLLGTHLHYLHRFASPAPELRGFGFFARHLERRLDLDAEQARQVEAILESHRQEVMRLHDETAPKVHAEFDAARREIEELLTPEQRRRLQRLRPWFLGPWHHHAPD